jgi:phosphoketolase
MRSASISSKKAKQQIEKTGQRNGAQSSDSAAGEDTTMATTLSKKEAARSKTENMLSNSESALIDAYWRAANYLSVGQIYLFDNPLLRQPLKEEHIKPRLLGHWGTTPGLNFIYAHLNRLIKELDLGVIYVTGPGHGGPGLVANAYLEGTYSEVYPGVSQDVEGMKRLFTQFSFPGGIPSRYQNDPFCRNLRPPLRDRFLALTARS